MSDFRYNSWHFYGQSWRGKNRNAESRVGGATDDVRKLRGFAKDRLSGSQAAKKLNRTPGAVAQKAMTLRIRFRSINRKKPRAVQAQALVPVEHLSRTVATPNDPSKMMLIKIVSGGQTGVDRGALDAALAANFPCGGWCPEGRQSEDGRIPDNYPLRVLAGSGYRQRTLKNVLDTDGTLILFTGSLTGGTKLTQDLCLRGRKELLLVDAAQVSVSEAIDEVGSFIKEQNIRVLNVAGPRRSGWNGGHEFAFNVIAGVIWTARSSSAIHGTSDEPGWPIPHGSPT